MPRTRVSLSQCSAAIRSEQLRDFSSNPVIPEVYPKHRNRSERTVITNHNPEAHNGGRTTPLVTRAPVGLRGVTV